MILVQAPFRQLGPCVAPLRDDEPENVVPLLPNDLAETFRLDENVPGVAFEPATDVEQIDGLAVTLRHVDPPRDRDSLAGHEVTGFLRDG